MNNERVLSVSIAAYNVEEYLDEAVESIMSSGIQDEIEIIIVNDGSSDATASKAKALKEKYPYAIEVINKENGGYGSTINHSLKVAKGKYYKLLDGDDWFNSSAIQDYIEYLRTNEADMVITPYYLINNDRTLVDNHLDIEGKSEHIDKIDLSNLNFHMTEIAIKTDCLRTLSCSITENAFYTDVEFLTYAVIAASTISKFIKPIYCYRIGIEGQSISLSGYRKHYKDQARVLKAVYACYSQYDDGIRGTKREILDNIIVNTIRITYLSHLIQEDYGNSRKELVNIDKHLKNNRTLYKLGDRSVLVKMLRLFKFRPYSFWCKHVTYRFKKNGLAL